MKVNELTRKLIDIPSVTGDEKLVGMFLQTYLEDLGYSVQLQEVAADRFNVVATTNAAPRVVLSTHMDTVPPFIQSSEDDENIYGRGACDAKGIIAAQIVAAERLRVDFSHLRDLPVAERDSALAAVSASLEGKPAQEIAAWAAGAFGLSGAGRVRNRKTSRRAGGCSQL